MITLEEKIKKEGKVFPGNVLKVGSFLNHMVDVPFMMTMAREICDHYKGKEINKVLTVEASGIALAVLVASVLEVPAVFAKKNKTSNISDNLYSVSVRSYTHNCVNTVVVEKPYLTGADKVLVVDDFLASGSATEGLTELIRQAGAELVGIAVAIEKGFQDGGKILRESGVDVCSLAIVESMSDRDIVFRHTK